MALYPRKRFVLHLCLACFWGQPLAAAEGELTESASWRWTNTIKYSGQFRLEEQDRTLLTDLNADDGDRNFRPGVVSSRLDLSSHLDVSQRGYGISVGAEAWYDSIYQQRTDNDSPETFNPVSVSNTNFTHAVKRQHGGDIELTTAFVYGGGPEANLPFSFRAGRFTLLWGESLFFQGNGIAGGQAPIDYLKVRSGPVYYSQEASKPVAQTWIGVDLAHGISLEGYYQFEWRRSREYGVGAYLSSEDYLRAGAERYFLDSEHYLLFSGERAPRTLGQLGLAMRWNTSDVDFGIYALRFHSKEPTIYFRPETTLPSGPPLGVADPVLKDLGAGNVGTYEAIYPENIELYGLSASSYLGDSNIAAEISLRRNMPLQSVDLFVRAGQRADKAQFPLYPLGNTLHAQASTVTNLGRSSFWDNAIINGEVAGSYRLSIEQNVAALDPDTDTLAMAFRGTFQPTYHAVMPNVDITLSVGLGYGFLGNSPTDEYQQVGVGDATFGVIAVYRTVWSAQLSITSFLGSNENQSLADRDYLSFSVQRSF